MLINLSSLLDLLGATTRHAVIAIHNFATDLCAKHFTFEQASAVNAFILKGNTRKQDAEGLSMLSRPFITEKGYAKSKTEQQNVITDFSSYEQTEREHLVELHR